MKYLVILSGAILFSAFLKGDSYVGFKESFNTKDRAGLEKAIQDYYSQEDGRIIIQEDHNIGTSAPNAFNVDATFEYQPNTYDLRPYGDLTVGDKVLSPYAGNGYSQAFEYDNDLFGDTVNVSLKLSSGAPYFSTEIYLPKTTTSSVTGPLVDDLNISWAADPGANSYAHVSIYYTHGFPKNIQFTEPEVENFLLVPNTGSYAMSPDLLDGVPVGALVLMEITQFSYKIVTVTSPVDNLPKKYKVMARSTVSNFFERQ